MKDLYIINGFLGAGKTTFIQGLFNTWKEKRVAVVVNEFSSVEGLNPVLRRDGIELIEINNGSIFCSCLSDRFIESLRLLAERDLDIVVVESSGLSNPSGIGKLISLVQSLTNDAFFYRGSVTLVDAVGFEDICETSVTARQQVVNSDLLLLNKTDLTTPERLDTLQAILTEFNPFARIIRTVFAKIEVSDLEGLSSEHTLRSGEWTGGSVVGTQKLLIALEGDFAEADVYAWLKAVIPYLYRIKGFIRIDGSWRYINSTTKTAVIEPAPFVPQEGTAVVLAPGHLPVKKKMGEQWNTIFGAEHKLVLL